jgi:hypothetical protein
LDAQLDAQLCRFAATLIAPLCIESGGRKYCQAMAIRLLIAAGESASGVEQLPLGVRELIDAADEILVVAPELPSRFEWLASATDKRREEADSRLEAVLGHLEQLSSAARGEVGADDPMLAFEDAIREFRPDHILIGLRGPDQAGWQERGLLHQLLERFRLPVTAFVVPMPS